ncbi:MAG: primosomal protein N' [Armatimonadota bacterium]
MNRELPFAHVLPDPGRALSQLFTYAVPEHLRASLTVGAQVLVPFGPRTVVGVVAALSDSTDRENLREIEALLEDVPALAPDALPLAEWLADYYLCELGAALRPFFTEGMSYRIGRRVRLSEVAASPDLERGTGGEDPSDTGQRGEARLGADAEVVLGHLRLQGKEVGLGALRRLLPRERLRKALRSLKSRGLIVERATVLPPRARERQIRFLELAVSPPEVEAYSQAKAARAPARVACLRMAAEMTAEQTAITALELARRADTSTSTVQALVKEGLLRPHWTPLRRTPWGTATDSAAAHPPFTLTPEQAQAVERITEAIGDSRAQSFLLYGVTASGKTEVFLRVIERVLASGKQAIVLMPEISLTAQAVGIYRARFGQRVAVLHSALALGERWDEWQRIRTGEAAVVIGARSALFAPVQSLGLIVVDEEHEPSYKQEQDPRYHAREVALKRAELNRCPVILASATPALETFHAALDGRHALLRLPTRIDDRPLPAVRLVDMRGSKGQTAILSNPLRQAIAARLRPDAATQEQVIIFLNRRGFATFLLCPICGQAVRCAGCGVSLKYSSETRSVRCHHCNLTRPAPDFCAKCGGRQIKFSGFGTERVERELRRIFPFARLGRMDRDTTVRKGSHLRIVGQFRAAETNVLIGTQMVAKGFDFPGVTLVGVVSADTSLNLPDFRAAERTFQLLTQVSGRAGRGEREGEVIVQTYRPDDYSVQAAAQHDYELFYSQEIENRRELNYPPFSRLVNIVVSEESEGDAERRAAEVASALRAEQAGGKTIAVLGPAPAPLAKLRGRYRWHVIAKGLPNGLQQTVRRALLSLRDRQAGTLTVDVDPVSLM